MDQFYQEAVLYGTIQAGFLFVFAKRGEERNEEKNNQKKKEMMLLIIYFSNNRGLSLCLFLSLRNRRLGYPRSRPHLVLYCVVFDCDTLCPFWCILFSKREFKLKNFVLKQEIGNKKNPKISSRERDSQEREIVMKKKGVVTFVFFGFNEIHTKKKEISILV